MKRVLSFKFFFLFSDDAEVTIRSDLPAKRQDQPTGGSQQGKRRGIEEGKGKDSKSGNNH